MPNSLFRRKSDPFASMADHIARPQRRDVDRLETNHVNRSIVEEASVSIVSQGVPPEQRSMSLDKIFWSHFSPNLCPGSWIIGLLIASVGLDFRWGLAAILIGNIIGTTPTALIALIGPATGLTQIESSRHAFGRWGTRLPATFNWFTCVGWVAIGNIIGTLSLVEGASLVGLSVPFWAALLVLNIATIVVAVYGHHVVQLLEKYSGFVFVVVFGGLFIVASAHMGDALKVHRSASWATFLMAVTLAASNELSWSTLSSDYTRYVPRTTPGRSIFLLVFFGLGGSAASMEILGLLTANQIASVSTSGFIHAVVTMSGAFAPLVLLIFAINAVAGNAIGTTTASYSLISTGIHIPRTFSAGLAGLFACAFTLIASKSFLSAFENYLILLVYWVAPWIGIVLADWYCGTHGLELRPQKWRAGATIFVIIMPLTILLFASTSIYTSPVAKLLGGVDIGYYVGSLGAALLYFISYRSHSEIGVTVA